MTDKTVFGTKNTEFLKKFNLSHIKFNLTHKKFNKFFFSNFLHDKIFFNNFRIINHNSIFLNKIRLIFVLLISYG